MTPYKATLIGRFNDSYFKREFIINEPEDLTEVKILFNNISVSKRQGLELYLHKGKVGDTVQFKDKFEEVRINDDKFVKIETDTNSPIDTVNTYHKLPKHDVGITDIPTDISELKIVPIHSIVNKELEEMDDND